MKLAKDVIACVVDYGNFESLADKLGETYKKVYYYTPYETEYRDVAKCVIGCGLPHVERCDEFLAPAVLSEIDLFVFPDIGFAGLQRHLLSLGKAVWGSREATDLELDRALFLDVLKDVGLPVPTSKVIKGLAALNEYLKRERDKWIKINFYRANMETWHHLDYVHSIPMLKYLETCFGGAAEEITFVVQTVIPNAQENGYDGYCVDGKFPTRSFQGYEKKNELYLGAWLDVKDMPAEVQKVNEAFSKLFKDIGYRNFFATEIRDEFFIDPTVRMAGQSQEHLLETCSNLADIVWQGANGTLVEPKFEAKFAASATLHYKEVPGGDGWKVVTIPQKVARWFKLANYCQDGDTYHFPPGKCDEIGVVIGNGDTIEASIEAIKEHLKVVKDEPFSAEVAGFADILRDIHTAESEGVKFSNAKVPAPEIAL